MTYIKQGRDLQVQPYTPLGATRTYDDDDRDLLYRAKIAFRAKIVLDLLIELKPCSFFDTQDITVSCQREVNIIRPVSYGNDCFSWLPMDKTQQTDEMQNCSCTRS